MHALLWVASGLVVGSIAGRLTRGRSRGPAIDLVEATPAADLETRIRRLGKAERAAIDHVLHRHPLKDPNAIFEEQLTFGQRAADRVAGFGGSWRFIGLFLLLMFIWMMLNTGATRRFDPFPFILLNLVLSCLAALQAPVIMMSQNRQAAKDRLDAQHDFEVNTRAEMEIVGLHAKIDSQQETLWTDLMQLQQRQIDILESIAAKFKER